jgi:MtaA/CmuA family methyltransferase
MTPEERFLTTMNLQEPDRVPACPWVTSAFFAPLYGVEPDEWYADRELQLKAMVEFYTRFPDLQYFPGFRASCGSTVEASGLGCEIVTLPGQTPHANPIVDDPHADVAKLKVPDPEQDGRMPMVLDHFRWLSERLPEHGFEVTAGFLHAPFDVALLVRGATPLLEDLYDDPDGVHALMDVVTETCIMWANAQYEACGGTIRQIMFSDDAGSQLSPEHWKAFSGRYIERLVEGMPDEVVTIAHNCYRVDHLLDLYPDTGVDALQLAPDVEIGEAKERVGGQIALIGNLDPHHGALLKGTPEDVDRKCRELIAQAAPGGGYILSASGCLDGETPMENIEALVHAAEKYGHYPISI